jgi:hypothetical protein
LRDCEVRNRKCEDRDQIPAPHDGPPITASCSSRDCADSLMLDLMMRLPMLVSGLRRANQLRSFESVSARGKKRSRQSPN